MLSGLNSGIFSDCQFLVFRTVAQEESVFSLNQQFLTARCRGISSKTQQKNAFSKHMMGNFTWVWINTLIPFLGGWTSIYQLFWCELQGYQGFDTLPLPKTFQHLEPLGTPLQRRAAVGPTWTRWNQHSGWHLKWRRLCSQWLGERTSTLSAWWFGTWMDYFPFHIWDINIWSFPLTNSIIFQDGWNKKTSYGSCEFVRNRGLPFGYFHVFFPLFWGVCMQWRLRTSHDSLLQPQRAPWYLTPIPDSLALIIYPLVI